MRLILTARCATVLSFTFVAISSSAFGQTPPTTVSPLGQAPSDADPNRMADKALELLDQGNRRSWEEAGEILDKLRRIDPQLPRLHLALGRWFAADGKGPQAIRCYEFYKNSSEGKADYRPFAELGRMYLRSRSLRMARRHLDDARQLAPEQESGKFVRAEIMMDLANVMHQLGDKAEALKVGRDAAMQARKDPRIQILFSRLLLAVNPNETRECREAAAAAIRELQDDIVSIPPSIPKMSMVREALLVVQQTWVTEVSLQSENAEPAHFLSLATQDVAEITQRMSLVNALEYEERAIELNGSKAEYRIRQAEIEAMLGSTRTALEKLDAVLKAEPDNPEALSLKTRINTTPVRKFGAAAGL